MEEKHKEENVSTVLQNCTWNIIPVQRDTPSPRQLHSAVVRGDSLYIFGGFNSQGKSMDDLYEYDVGKDLLIVLISQSARYLGKDKTERKDTFSPSFSHGGFI